MIILNCAFIFVNMLQYADKVNTATAAHFVTNVQNVCILDISQKYSALREQPHRNSCKTTYLCRRQQFSEHLINALKYLKMFVRLSKLNLSGIIINDKVC